MEATRLKARRRAIVVEDDYSILETLVQILQRKGFDVDTATTGKEAVEKTNRLVYDVALIDVRLPDMEGTELLSKAGPGFSKAVKIILTGLASYDGQAKALDLGADAYLLKPVKPEQLLLLIEQKLETKG